MGYAVYILIGLLNSWDIVAEGHSEGGFLQNSRGDVKTPLDVQADAS